MKQLFLAIGLFSLSIVFAPLAQAHKLVPSFSQLPNSQRVEGYVIESYPVVNAGAPQTQRVCENVEVPIYAHGQQTNQAGDVLAGIVVGGVIGKVLTGKDSGAAVGAIIGGAAAANNQQQHIVGYRTERQCHMVEVANDQVDFYRTRINLQGKVYRVRSSYPFRAGDTVYMWVHH